MGERFAGNHDLPNTSTYNETCASIGLALFALRTLDLDGKSAEYKVEKDFALVSVSAGKH